MRLSSARPSPQPAPPQAAQATSAPPHSSEPSPPVKVLLHVVQFIEPDVSNAMSRRGLTSVVEKPPSASFVSLAEWQPGSAGKSTLPSPSLSTPSEQAGYEISSTSLALVQPGSA